MEQTLYLWMAILGSSILVIQIILQIIGLDADTEFPDGDIGDLDMDGAHGADGNMFFGILSIKALVAFCAIFGLTGLTVYDTIVPRSARLLSASLAGFAGMLLVAWLMRLLASLYESGTVNIAGAVGKTARVYLRIPAKGGGQGKVTLELQSRTVELNAITDGDAVATGAHVRIVEVLDEETVKVESD